MELIFLGTGAGIPSKQRNVASVALSLLQETNSIWLFDCGEATQHQILKTSIKPRKINKIFITHMHGDHVFGLPGLLSSRSFQGGDGPLTVYGPEGIEQFITKTLSLSQTHITYPLSVVEVKEGKILETDRFTVYCKELLHGVPSYGYRIVEKDRIGPLLVERLKAEGIPPGPLYQQIKENEEVITEDGKVLKRRDFVGPNQPGKVICILGDTREPKHQRSFVQGADLLVHEATFSHADLERAYQYDHTTATQAAELAKAAQIKRLILTHISSRYQDDGIEQLLEEAKQVFPKTEIAEDLSIFSI